MKLLWLSLASMLIFGACSSSETESNGRKKKKNSQSETEDVTLQASYHVDSSASSRSMPEKPEITIDSTTAVFFNNLVSGLNNNEEMPEPIDQPQDTGEDSYFSTESFSRTVGENELYMDFPTHGNSRLLSAIRKWLNESLGNSYADDLDNGEEMFSHYASQLGKDPDLNEYGGYTRERFRFQSDTEKTLTYMTEVEFYGGGAHGMEGQFGTTFLREDGSQFSRDCFISYNALNRFIIPGLKKFFDVSSDSELEECLLVKLSDLEMPETEPWIENDEAVFTYAQYEIAPYSAGRPQFRVSLEELYPYLTSQGRRFTP